MGNGAAGCGYENANHNGNCGFLNREKQDTDEIFDCTKHRISLKIHHITGHPFRCRDCKKGKKVGF